jgi:DNA repair exonuclease SbcCD ATPase subunit
MGSVSFIDGHIDEPMNAEEYIEVIKRLKLKLENLTDLYNRQKADLENYKQIAEFQQSISMDKEVEIKRLKAEVERLKKEKDEYAYLYDKHINTAFSHIKAEAVKEFAERLDKEFAEIESKLPDNKIVKRTAQILFNAVTLVKMEMVGEDK